MSIYTQQLTFPMNPCCQQPNQAGGKRKQKGGSCDQVPVAAHFVYPCWATQQSGTAAEHAWDTRTSTQTVQHAGAGAVKGKKAAVPKYRKERPSPSSSATEFKVGTRRKGNDGNFYKVVINKEGVKRWQKIKPAKK